MSTVALRLDDEMANVGESRWVSMASRMKHDSVDNWVALMAALETEPMPKEILIIQQEKTMLSVHVPWRKQARFHT